MIRNAFNASLALVIFGAAAIAFFTVPLGQRTLYEHASRIAATEEAEELGADVEKATRRVEARLREELERPVQKPAAD